MEDLKHIKTDKNRLNIEYQGLSFEINIDRILKEKRIKLSEKKFAQRMCILKEIEYDDIIIYIYLGKKGNLFAAKDLDGFDMVREIVVNAFPIFYKKNNHIQVSSMCCYRLLNENANKKWEKFIEINGKDFPIYMLFNKGIKFLKFGKYTYFFSFYKVKFDMDFLKTCPLTNLLKIKFTNNDEKLFLPIVYNVIYYKKNEGHTSRIYKFKDVDNLVCYFRQGNSNSFSISIRTKNITDNFKNKFKIFVGWLFSKILRSSNRILLYEKECSKYEESSSMVYEKLIDMGYKNAYYIIDRNSNHVKFIKEKYLENIIWSHTFKHYLNFFRCKKFIGTESVVHSLEVRTANTFVTKKLQAKKFKYVFLQHGVMYMVSLDAQTRGFFRKGKAMPLDAKIVVSSKVEADHFVELGGFDYEDLYITGLPFYDRTIKKENADKITVMPTWRPWDYNILISEYEKSSYYRMMYDIYKSVPKELREKVILLPHPMIIDIFKNTPLGKYVPDIQSYDLILEDTALLITDYSSIAYSAFYRGSNVIFVWKEKEECMEHYEGHLMLNEDNTFGDVIYNYNKLNKVIKQNYLKNQKDLYKNNYKKIVEFNDNKNTERLIEMLKKDKFIRR